SLSHGHRDSTAGRRARVGRLRSVSRRGVLAGLRLRGRGAVGPPGVGRRGVLSGRRPLFGRPVPGRRVGRRGVARGRVGLPWALVGRLIGFVARCVVAGGHVALGRRLVRRCRLLRRRLGGRRGVGRRRLGGGCRVPALPRVLGRPLGRRGRRRLRAGRRVGGRGPGAGRGGRLVRRCPLLRRRLGGRRGVGRGRLGGGCRVPGLPRVLGRRLGRRVRRRLRVGRRVGGRRLVAGRRRGLPRLGRAGGRAGVS